MATSTKLEELATTIVSSFKSIVTVINNVPSFNNKKLEILTNSYGRWKLKFWPDDESEVSSELLPYTNVPSSYNEAFLTTDNLKKSGNDEWDSKPIYGMLLKVPSINADTITLTIPGLMGTKWPSRDFKQIDESLSYFYNSTTDDRITFSSMYHLGLQTVSLNNSVVLNFATGSSLSDWEMVICIKCNLDD